jgi:integrase
MLVNLPPYVDTANDLVDWCQSRYAAETTRRLIQHLNACYRWAVKTGRTRDNPFAAYVGTIRKTAYNRREAFTAKDRDRIIAEFRRRDPYYSPYVEFAFKTGARHEELRGLEWGHIGANVIRFQQAIASGATQPAPLKTLDRRDFPIKTVTHLLDLQKGLHPRWVFPSPDGCQLDGGNFRARHWHYLVNALAQNGEIDWYLPPSHTRHTFITLAIRAGMGVSDVAKLVGNSPETIWKHYSQASRDIEIPDF